MFESLKNKLKNVFHKGSEIKPEDLSKDEPQKAPQAEPKKLSRKEELKEKKSGGKKVDDMLTDNFMGKKVDANSLDDILWDLEIALLEADVALPVVEEIKTGVKNKLTGRKYSRENRLDDIVEEAIKESVRDVLQLNEFDFDAWFEEQKKPAIIMFVGINGTGKTTVIAKLANRLIKNDHTVVLAACDTFRAGAIEQLSIHAEKLNCKIVKHDQDADPAAVAFDAMDHARAKMKDAVLIDTAGRMQTNNNLIDEMKKIARVSKPTLKVFVGDSLSGNDAVIQAKSFDDAIGIDAVILTKIDADSKGGAALSIAHTIGKPIAFVCNGQEYEDIIKFNTQWMIDRLFE